MKKKILIVFIVIITLGLIGSFAGLAYYKNSLQAVGDKNEEVNFKIENGTTSKMIVDQLYDANLVKNKYAGYIYLKTHKNISLQAGNYNLNRGMNFEEIISVLNKGDVIDDSITVTFVEGKRITYFATKISEAFPYEKDEIISKISDKDYLNKLIDKYWFLESVILDDKIYYPLEGYLYPNTYQFKKDATIEEIIEKILDNTNSVLKKYQEDIENSEHSIHEILTMASIVELEGANSDDRGGVAGVFYNRLNAGWSLGSDVTTYYAEKLEMSERDLYIKEINSANAYNTRSVTMAGKLPVGPICNPSTDSIKAALNPTSHDYYYFVADKNKKTYFSKTDAEHTNTINRLKSENLWFEYK